jgi:hypothetical protein
MLLTAITTINRGQPSEPPQPYDEKYHGSYERPSNSRELALNAIATLLVRYHEVFAVVAHSSQQVFAMQDGAQVDHKEQDDSRLSAFISKALNVYAVANPNKKKPYQYFSRLESCYCKIAEHGTSHYNLISDSNWDCLTIR